MRNRPVQEQVPSFLRVFGWPSLAVCLFVMALGCNSDGGEAFSVDGSWQGSVAEAEAEITMVLVKQGKNGIAGTAQVTAPPEGQVSGTVSGTKKGAEVGFTIEVDDVIVGGSLAFDGAFQSEDVISGTIDSGILGGNFAITFQRQGA
jgi:hypothetical protein